MKTKKRKLTLIRRVVLNPNGGWHEPSRDFGIGPGVLAEEIINCYVYDQMGIEHPRVAAFLEQEAEMLLHELFSVQHIKPPTKPARKPITKKARN